MECVLMKFKTQKTKYKGSGNPMFGKKRPDRVELNKKRKGIFKHSEETKRKISDSCQGINKGNKNAMKNPIYLQRMKENHKGILHDDASKFKMRMAVFKYAKKYGPITWPRKGKHETIILNRLEKLFKYKIIRQYEIYGYFLDGYIPELNLAIEIDESHHDLQKEKDKIRECLIKTELRCKFLRVKDYY